MQTTTTQHVAIKKTAYRKPYIAPRSLMHFTFVNIAYYPSLLSPAQKKRMEQYPKVVPSAIFYLNATP